MVDRSHTRYLSPSCLQIGFRVNLYSNALCDKLVCLLNSRRQNSFEVKASLYLAFDKLTLFSVVNLFVPPDCLSMFSYSHCSTEYLKIILYFSTSLFFIILILIL